MRYRTPALVFLALSVILFICALLMGFRAFGGHEASLETPAPASSAEAAPQQEPAADSSTTVPETTNEPIPEPTAIPTATPEPTATPWPGPATPQQSVKVGKEYFADAAFLGNSVLSGLWYYDYGDVLPDGSDHWFWDDGLTILGAVPYADQMSGGQYGKIYVGFGNNEMAYDKTALRQAYGLLLDKLQADHPNAIIYLVSATPVSLWKSSTSSSYTRELVQAYNSMLKDICVERQVWYQDAYSVLCNEEGYLPSDVTNDGTHFTPAHYELWFDYMQTHYIPDGTEVPLATDVPAEGGGT